VRGARDRWRVDRSGSLCVMRCSWTMNWCVSERVQRRYGDWLAANRARDGRSHPNNVVAGSVATHIGAIWKSMPRISITASLQSGGQVTALRTFGPQLKGLLDELNERLNVDRLEG